MSRKPWQLQNRRTPLDIRDGWRDFGGGILLGSILGSLGTLLGQWLLR